jgi:drug/metabolite transporter (DMT)-like permease
VRQPAHPARSAGVAAWTALFVVWVVWGSTYLAIRVADRTIPPFEMAAVQYLTAGLLLYPVALPSGQHRSRPDTPAAHAPAAARALRSGWRWPTGSSTAADSGQSTGRHWSLG